MFTDKQLHESSYEAGIGLFGVRIGWDYEDGLGERKTGIRGGLVWHAETPVIKVKLSQLWEAVVAEFNEENHKLSGYLDDFEYLFYPSTGKGLDKACECWADVETSWQDVDGNIYTYWVDGILVIEVDVKIGGIKQKKLQKLVKG